MGKITQKTRKLIDWGMDIYTKVQCLAFKLPFVCIDKHTYLTQKLGRQCSRKQLEEAIATTPVAVLGIETIHRIARKTILKHALLTSVLSFFAAIPYNIYVEMFLLALDLIQFQIMVFIIAQKLMYLYGYSPVTEEDREKAMGVMLTVSAIMIGSHRVTHTLKSVTGSAARKIVLQASTRAGNRILAINFIRQACKWMGIEVTKNTIILSFNIIIDICCCLISGLISFWLIYPMCNRLVAHFEKHYREKQENSAS